MRSNPSIRFDEISGKWKHREFNKVFNILKNNALSRAELSNECGIAKNIHYGDILVKFGDILDTDKAQLPYITDDAIVTKYATSALRDGDVIIADTAEDETVGKCCELLGIEKDIVISGLHTIPCRPQEEFASGYLGYYMNSDAYHMQLLPLMQGTKVTSISKAALSETVIKYPCTKEEQALISQYFCQLDYLIGIHQDKHDKMVDVRKSMLEKLFVQGERISPQIRFGEYKVPWKKVRLGEIVVPYSDPIETPHGGYERLGIRSYGKGVFHDYVEAGKELGVAQMHRVASHNLIVNITFAWEHAVAITDDDDAGKLVSHRFPQFAMTDDIYDQFLKYMILDARFRHHLMLSSPGGAGRNRVLKVSEMLEYEMMIPEVEEQKQIADYLNSLDELISLYKVRVEKLKKYKNGLYSEDVRVGGGMGGFDDEKKFEKAVIDQLIEFGWEKQVLNYPTEDVLIRNWADILFANNRQQDVLNDCPLTDSEMAQIVEQIIRLRTPVKLNDFINGKSVSIKRDNPDDTQNFGKEVSLKIYDRREIAFGSSRYQIVRQPIFKTAPRLNDRRGDLMLLINGMPVIHIELKKSGIPVSNAYNQIEKYAHEGVFTGFFSLIQVFVAMEPAEAVYFANPGPDGVFNMSFYFHWADFDNVPYSDWQDVVKYLLNIPMAHELIGYYTIPDAKDDTLKVMRSYQYRAAKAISDAVMDKDWTDTNNLGGHIWHTTGSGKTLTSFKSAQLIVSARTADKVVFLVDRKALGKQSFDDYRAFASASEEIQDTADTDVLVTKLKSDDYSDSLIITSIQKLSNVTRDAENIKSADIDKIVSKRIVIIIDEAHRSTFGEMLTNIKTTFVHAIIFGFTGTPIQDANSKKDNTTTTIFGNELHRYTLADGIRDKNVLGFDPYMEMTYQDMELREQVALMKAKAKSVSEVLGNAKKEKVYYKFMDRTKVRMVGEWKGKKYIKGIEDYVPNSQYDREEHQIAVIENIIKYWTIFSRGGLFHAIFATHSIPEAVKYYRLFKSMAPHLQITAVFDPTIDNEGGGTLEKEDGIVEILEDYEAKFGPSFSIPTYDAFREDVQLRLAHKKPYNRISKDKQINLLIVVNQMLTGYDSKWINTLYLDKMLEYENLIQAFSRTNRLFGDEKPFGIIKYYRRPHTMKRNIEVAVKAYSGDIPTGLFVDKLPSNLNSMNRFYDEMEDLFKNAGIKNFEKLPGENSEKRKFAKLFKQFNQKLEAAQIQGFSWAKDTYAVIEADGTESYIVMNFDYNTYLVLLQRYKEFPSGGGGGTGEEPPFEIDAHITEINTDAINADYMNSRFDKFFKLWQQGDYDQAAMDQVLRDLHKSFAMLSQIEQRYANLFISDIQSGEVKFDPTMTFRDYIAKYMRKAEDARIARIVRRLGCYEDLLRKLLDRKVNVSNYKDFGYFDELVCSVDRGKAEKFFIVIEKNNYKPYRLQMLVSKYLRDFVISGGIDPYADVIDVGRKTAKKQERGKGQDTNQSQSENGIAIENDLSYDEDVDDEVVTRTTVSSHRLSHWYNKSNALACMMNTGCFAYIEEKVCLDEPKYVERQDSGKMCLTAYAKEHEEECFLQFKMGADGKLHYIKLPESIADKEFHYTDYISEDILKQLGLVNEIAEQMLDVIRDMGFGDALRELMSNRVCNYSVNVLKDITGLDNNTIEKMWNDKSLTKVNVVSACLGLHLPFPVSSTLVEAAALTLNMFVGSTNAKAENRSYQGLLSTRWASEYDDIYDDLKAEGMETLIKNATKGENNKEEIIDTN